MTYLGPKNKAVNTTGRTVFWHMIFPLSRMWKENQIKAFGLFKPCYFQVLLLKMHKKTVLFQALTQLNYIHVFSLD